MPKKEYHDVTLFLHASTEKAIRCSEDNDIGKAFWLPKSVIDYETNADGTVIVTLPTWLASEKGLAGF